MLCAMLALASCKKDDMPQAEQSKEATTVTLDISAVTQDVEQKGKSEARAMFYFDPAGKLRTTLKGREKTKVYTLIYNGDELVHKEALQWTVSEDGKTLSYKEPITTIAHLDPNKETKLVAILFDEAFGKENPSSPEDWWSYYPGYEIQKAYIIHKSGSIDNRVSVPSAPFALECTLSVNADGTRATNRDLRADLKRFKPKGYFVEFTLSNHTGRNIEVKSVLTNGAERIRYKVREGKYAHRDDPSDFLTDKHSTTRLHPIAVQSWIRGAFSESEVSIAIENGKTYPRPVYLWMPTLDGVSFDFDYFPNNGCCPIYKQKGERSSYEQGSIYKIDVDFKPLPNPLSYFTQGPISADGTQILAGVGSNDPNVGLFTFDEAKNLTIRRDDDHDGVDEIYKLPTQSQWNSILPTFDERKLPIPGRPQGSTVPVVSRSGDNAVIGYNRLMPRIDGVGGYSYFETVIYSFPNGRKVTQAYRFLNDQRRFGSTVVYQFHGDPFVFRYITHEGSEWTTIQCRRGTLRSINLQEEIRGGQITDAFAALGNNFWNDPSVVTRTFPSVDILHNGSKMGGSIFWGISDGTDPKYNPYLEYLNLRKGDRTYVPYGGAFYAWLTTNLMKVSPNKHPSAERYPVYLYKQN